MVKKIFICILYILIFALGKSFGATISISPTDAIMIEGHGNDTIIFTISCDTCSGETVDWTFNSQQSATLNVDYTSSINPGTISSFPTTITLSNIDDNNAEGDETITIDLSNPTGGASLGVSSATAVIIDDDFNTDECLNASPITIYEDSFDVEFFTDDTATECKWRIGAAPNDTQGFAVDSLSGSYGYARGTNGYQNGTNHLFIGCKNTSDIWGVNSIDIIYNNPVVEDFKPTITTGTGSITSGTGTITGP